MSLWTETHDTSQMNFAFNPQKQQKWIIWIKYGFSFEFIAKTEYIDFDSTSTLTVPLLKIMFRHESEDNVWWCAIVTWLITPSTLISSQHETTKFRHDFCEQICLLQYKNYIDNRFVDIHRVYFIVSACEYDSLDRLGENFRVKRKQFRRPLSPQVICDTSV